MCMEAINKYNTIQYNTMPYLALHDSPCNILNDENMVLPPCVSESPARGRHNPSFPKAFT